MAEHTPTPWKLGRTLDKHPCIISTVTETRVREEDEANAWRKIACVNAFHSPDGRTIATEQISEGLVFRLVNTIDDLLASIAMGPLEIAAKYGPDAHPDEAVVDAARRATTILASLKVEEPE